VDSHFADVEGLSVHYKLRRPGGVDSIVRKMGAVVRDNKPAPAAAAAAAIAPAGPATVVSCVHGFGANTYSWERAALQPLATALNATVVVGGGRMTAGV
jgi:pimeloyl-ACP methyl ester carboxylesterase